MASNFYNSYATLIANTLSGNYIGLILDTGAEVSTGGYARQQVNFAVSSEDTTYFYLTNTADIVFPVATADYGTIAKYGLYDSSTLGNLLLDVDLDISKYVYTNDQVIFYAGDIVIKIPKNTV